MVHTIGEASSSRRRKQKKPRIFSFYEDKVEKGEEGVVQSGTLLKLNLLDCPICTKPLTNPIFQCDNGHVACSSCCTKVRYKCPSCTSSIGDYRCRMMEDIVELMVFPCPYAKHGCKEKMFREKVAAHTKECGFVLGSCLEPFCN